LPKRLLLSREYAALRNGARALLIDVAAQYNGYNNGALTAAWKPMQDRGWKSKRGLYRARDELLETGFLVITHYQRSTSRRPIYYAITWEGIDETKHTRDQRPSVVPLNTWKFSPPNVDPKCLHVDPKSNLRVIVGGKNQ